MGNAQWASMRRDVDAQIAATGVKRGALVSLVDVSGSMAGVPMEVSIALGLLVSDLADEPFKHRVLTFESQPRWHKIPSTASTATYQERTCPTSSSSATCSSTRRMKVRGRRTTNDYNVPGRRRATSCRR